MWPSLPSQRWLAMRSRFVVVFLGSVGPFLHEIQHILRDKLLMVSLLIERRLLNPDEYINGWLVFIGSVYQLIELFPTNEAHDNRRISTPNSNSIWIQDFFSLDGFRTIITSHELFDNVQIWSVIHLLPFNLDRITPDLRSPRCF